MAEANEPKKETVRITLPPRREDGVAPQDDDPVRINLPAGPPTSQPPPTTLATKAGTVPIPRPPISQVPLPKPSVTGVPAPQTFTPPAPPPAAKTPMPRPMGTAAAAPARMAISVPAAPPAPTTPATTPMARETARISILPDPPKATTAKMSKTQPLITLATTPATPPTAPVTIAPAARPQVIESIPTSLCWGLLFVAAATLIIEIWNYIS